MTESIRLFDDYLRVTGVAHLGPEPYEGELPYPGLRGKRLGLINGSSWITLWCNVFGRRYLPGVHLVNVGNEAVQLSFMDAHAKGLPCPPQANIEAFKRYARDLVDLAAVDAVMITCSTMNRAYRQVQEALAGDGVPVLQIDLPMMERAVENGGRVLVVATHGPTVENTQALLRETADAVGRTVEFDGVDVHEAWECLTAADLAGHNAAIDGAIRDALSRGAFGCVVLAQLSMSTLLFDHPDLEAEYGLPVLTSAECGFGRAREVLLGQG